MRDLWAVISNEWMKLISRARLWIVVGLAALSALGFCFLFYMNATNADDVRHRMNEQIHFDQEEIDRLKKNPGKTELEKTQSLESIKVLTDSIKTTKENLAIFEQKLTGDWKKAIQDEYKLIKQQEEQMLVEQKESGIPVTPSPEEDSMKQRDQLIRDYMLKLTERPKVNEITDAYSSSKEIFMLMAMIFLPFLVVILVADMMSGETTSGTIKLLLVRPVSRMKIIFGKWIVSLFATLLLAVGFFATTFGINVALYGTAGANSPNVVGVTGKNVMVKNLSTGQMENKWVNDYKQATVISADTHLLYTFLLAIVSMMVVASVTYFFSVMFKSAMVSTAVSAAIVILGAIFSTMGGVGKYLFWMFSYYGYLIRVWEGTLSYELEMNITLETSLLILGVWLVASVIGAIFIFRKKDILNA